MTTYTAIATGDIDPDSPITSTMMTLMRDNPIAMFEGASGAPRLQFAAIESLTAGSYMLYHDATGGSNWTNVYTLVCETSSFNRYGTVTVRFTLDAIASFGETGTVYAQIFKNGSPAGTERSQAHSASPTIYSEDISVSYGDIIQVYAKTNRNSVNLNSRVTEFKILSGVKPLTTFQVV